MIEERTPCQRRNSRDRQRGDTGQLRDSDGRVREPGHVKLPLSDTVFFVSAIESGRALSRSKVDGQHVNVGIVSTVNPDVSAGIPGGSVTVMGASGNPVTYTQ